MIKLKIGDTVKIITPSCATQPHDANVQGLMADVIWTIDFPEGMQGVCVLLNDTLKIISAWSYFTGKEFEKINLCLNCENWNERKEACCLRTYSDNHGYGSFLQGFFCNKDKDIKNAFIKKKPFKYQKEELVYYFDNTNLDKYSKIEEAILRIKITQCSYNSAAHEPTYDIGVPSGVNGWTWANERDLFATFAECKDQNIKEWEGHIKSKKRGLQKKIEEGEKAKEKLNE